MRALDEMHWIRQVMDVHTADDRIFQMDAQQLSAQIREACSLAGLEGEYNGHSPMIGMALDLAGADFDCKAMSLVRHLASPATANLIIRILNANNVIQPPQRLQADQLGVKVLIPAMLRPEHDDETPELVR